MTYYFAGMEGGDKNGYWNFLIDQKLPNLLLSYFYNKKVNWTFLKKNNFNILFDSGAFSAFTCTKNIN